jgi:HD-like signal output (HDOD) protein
MASPSLSRETILRLGQKLPTTPAVLGKLQVLLADPDSELDDICTLLKRDLALAARILRMSNSPFYGRSEPHSSLDDAVGRVGYGEIYKLVGLTITGQLFSRDLQFYGYQADRLWENILCCAIAMESLAPYVGINPRSAYTAGLMRSIGKIILDRVATETRPAPKPYAPAGGEPLGSWEMSLFGSDNPAVAAILLKEWNIPADTVAAVRQQYRPDAQSPADPAALALNIAGCIADDLGFGLPGEERYWESLELKLAQAKLTEGDFELCTAETKTAFENVRQSFSGTSGLMAVG